jgi:uncharacterized OsmC-like protein
MADKLWVESNGDGTWQAHSSDGATLKIGKGPGLFNPGDLIKVALAACGGLSSQDAVSRTLGQQPGTRIDVSGDYDEDNDRYNSFSETVTLDGSRAQKPMDEKEAQKFADRVGRHIAKDCTIAHTFRQATPVDIDIKVSGIQK